MKSDPHKRPMSSEDFRRLAERISKYVDFRGCTTERCINRRIRRKNSPELNRLIKAGFAYRLLIESWISPHPVYKKILDISDEDYDALVEEDRRVTRELKKYKLI